MKKTAMIRYTVEQLHGLRESPEVRKPDNLPKISEWMETPADQNNRKARQASGTEAENQRPNLVHARKVRSSFGYDDEPVFLEPPKFAFTSSSAVRSGKAADSNHKPSASQDIDNINGERIGQREQFFKDRENDRGRDRPGAANGRRGQRDDGEGWTNVRNRKVLENDDPPHPRFVKGTGKDREKLDGEDQPPRRAGVGKGRFEQPWGRDDTTTAAKDVDTGKFTNTRVSGWREREKERDRKDDRDWNRGARLDDDPEWMGIDAPLNTEKKQGRTQEDFQRWMKEMKNKTAGRDESNTNQESENLPETSKPKQETSTGATASSIPPTPLNLEGAGENFFGIWGEPKRTDPKSAEAPPTTKAGPSKPKPSRFASLFTPQEETKPPQDPPDTFVPTSPEPTGSSEDREGFQRILKMLGGTSIASQPPPPSGHKPNANGGAKPTPTAELPQQNYPLGLEQPTARHASARSKDRAAILDAILPKNSQSPFGLSSPSNNSAWEAPRSTSKNDFQEEYMQQPSSRNGGNGDVESLHFSQHRPISQTETSNREFLLNLIQQPRHTPTQTSSHDANSYSMEMINGSLSYGERGQNLQMPKARGPQQTGFLDLPDQDMYRRPTEINHPQDQSRKPAPRQPPGLYDDPSISANVQRRNTNDNPPRLPMSNMGIPQQQDPNWMKYQGMHTPQDRVPPPPGFPGRMQPQGPPNYGAPQHMQFPANNHPMGGGVPLGLQRGMPAHYQGQPQMGPPGFFGGLGGPGGPGGLNGPPPPGFPPMGLPQDMMLPQRRPVGPGPGPGGYDLFNEMQLRGRGGPPNHFM